MTAESEIALRLRRSWPQRLVLAIGIVLVLGSVSGAAGVAYLGWTYHKVHKYDIALAAVPPGEPANYLIVGSDSRAAIAKNDPNSGAFLDGAASGRRSDTILVVRVDPKRESATMLSLPRDLWVPIAGTGAHQRINAAYGLGKQVLADTIQQYLGVPINHYVEVDFHGFQGLVNAIGGVPMYFERAMRDTNSGLDVLHPGCVTLDGAAGLAFARSRHLQYIEHGVWHTDPTGDLGRITRQQLFVRKAISRAVSQGLTNPLTLNRLINVGVANVGIDKGLSPSDLAGLGRRFASFQGSQLVTYTLPVTPFRTPGGADVLHLDAAASVPTLDLFRTVKGAVPVDPGEGSEPAAAADVVPAGPGGVAVQVLNATGVAKRAANVAGALQRVGFPISGLGDASQIGGSRVAHSEIHYPAGHPAGAVILLTHLPAGATLVADRHVAAGSVVLVAGTDLTKVSAPAVRPPAGSAGGSSTRPTPTTVASTSTVPPTPTTAAPVGRTPGEVPPGVHCD